MPDSDTLESPPDAYRIVGTAGHIDHGKSTLVRALTGVDPDRLQEEKERGITIDLGFADTRLGDTQVGFIDVPGHERLVKNMLAGIGGIDAVLLVVAADESIMPQTREHFAICSMLGVNAGVVAITKSDLADDEMLELVRMEIEDLLEGSPLEGCEIVSTSAVGEETEVDDLRDALARCLSATPARAADGLLRLPVDRVFSVRGFGTVITGTVFGGQVRVGDKLQLLPGELRVQVRGIQVHGGEASTAAAGQRAALNLHGAQVGDVERGMVLTSTAELATSHMLDVRVDVLPGFELRHLQRVRFHHGAAERLGRLAVLDAERLSAGTSGYAQLRLERPYPAVPGDRFVLRRYSPVITIAGGTVLDAHPGRRRSGASSADDLRGIEAAGEVGVLTQWITQAGPAGLAVPDALLRLGRGAAAFDRVVEAAVEAGNVRRVPAAPARIVLAVVLDEMSASLRARLARYHADYPVRPAMPKQELRTAVAAGVPEEIFDAAVAAAIEGGTVRAAADGYADAEHEVRLAGRDVELRDRILELFAAAGLAAPPTAEILARADDDVDRCREVLHHALREGALLRVREDMVVDSRAMDALIESLRSRRERGSSFTVAEFKEWTGLTRKHSIPVLEHLDSRRVTRRVGDERLLL